MDLPAIAIDDALAAGHTLVAPNGRLVRLLKQRLALWQEPDARVFRTPPVTTLEEWLEAVWREARLLGRCDEAAPRRWTDDEELLLWEQALQTEQQVLLDSTAAARLARDTGQLVVRWRLRLDDDLAEAEWVQFRKWLHAYRKRSAQRGGLDAASWLRHAMLKVRDGTVPVPPATLVLVGYIEYTALDRELLGTLNEAGITVLQAALPQQPARIERVEAESLMDELRQAAAWARAYRDAWPGAQVAVLVHELGQCQGAVVRTFEDTFHPGLLFDGDGDPQRAYNLTLGRPLSDYPLAGVALQWLEWLANPGRPRPMAWVSRLLLSAGWAGADSEYTGRARWDAWLREQGRSRWTLSELRAALTHWSEKTGESLSVLESVLAALGDFDAPANTAEAALQWLTAVGWPGDDERPLTLAEKRTVNAVHRQLENFDRLRDWLPKGAVAQLGWFRRHCRETLHQPSGSDNAPVQVMGLIDAIGRRFDAVWIANLTEENWPAMPRPNPLIPRVYQRDLPHANSDRERQYARRVMTQLLGLAETVVLSHGRTDGDREVGPSPLITDWPPGVPPDAPVPGLTAALAREYPNTGLLEHPWLDWAPDWRGRPIPANARERVRGGAGLFRQQAACPLVGWATRALGCRALGEPVEELDAAERGSLVHAALEYFWGDVVDHDTLRTLDDAARHDRAIAAAEQAMQRQEAGWGRALPERYRRLEVERLVGLLEHWLAHEAARAPFTVVEREALREFTFAGFRVRGRIDRLDRLADGSLLLVDYKTGAVDIRRWFDGRDHARLLDPQLPLYAQSDPAIGAVVFARVRPDDDAGWAGVAAVDAGLGPGVQITNGEKPPGRKTWYLADYPDWDALQRFWRTRLNELAEELAEGVADPVVYDDSFRRYCDWWPLLREAELAQQDLAAGRFTTDADSGERNA